MKPALLSVAIYLFFVATVARAADEPANVAGSWKVTFDKADAVGQKTRMLILKQKGDELDGTLKGEGHEIRVTGRVNGNRLHMSARTIVTVELDAVVDKDNKNRDRKSVV